MPRLTLRVKLLASFVLILIPVLALLIYGFLDANERRVEALLDDQMQTAQAIAALVDASFDEAFALAWALTDDPLVHTFDPSQVDPHLQRLAPYYPQYEAISIINAEGDNVGSSLPFEEPQRLRIATDRPYFQQAMATGEPVISEVVISRRTLRPTIIVAVPIRDDDGRTRGIVLISLFLAALSSRLDGVALRPEQTIFLVDTTGTVAFHTSLPEIPWEERNLGNFEPIRAALEGRPSEVRRFVSPLLGDTRIGAFAPTPKYGWVVGATVPEDVALAPVRTALRDQLLGFSVVAILTVAVALVTSRRLLQPILRLTEQARALGKGDLTRRVDIKTHDEMEELGKTFNQMAERLERTLSDLRETLHLREEFLSAAAHELKTPLTSLRGYAQLLLRSKAARPAKEQQALEVIERQTRRIARLVEDLLETVSPTARPLQLRRIDLASLAEEEIREAAPAEERHSLILCRTGAVFAEADPNLIRRVLLTLLDNAMRFSPQGGRIEVTVTTEDGEALISVRDHGLGIPKERQRYVFEPFYEPFPAGTPGYHGATGLGLFVTKTIIERHGGHIWFESEEGKGSTFYFSLPLQNRSAIT
ncbi:MAG: sensor histidine kinase [Chloroflexi bacterium]|nr:sensor histidine kinase [Chloroflexota bacterium]